jgi:hypothetical protein
MTGSYRTAGWRRAPTLRREIVGLLCTKAAALAVIYFVFFGPSTRAHVTASGFAAHVLVPDPSPTH